MSILAKGANIAVGPVAPGGVLDVTVFWTLAGGALDLDVLAVPLDASGRVAAPSEVVYFNSRQHPSSAITLVGDSRGGAAVNGETIKVRPDGLPASITRIAFAVVIHDGAVRGQAFSDLAAASIAVSAEGSGTEICRFDLADRGPERAMVFGELYLHTSGWKFRAVGQGHAAGLGALGEQFGFVPDALDLSKGPAAAPAPLAPAAPAPVQSTAAPANLTKVVLTKSAPTVSLTKRDKPGGMLRVNLNWTARPQGASSGFLGRLAGGGASIDLDIACLYELTDGAKGVVQALGGSFQAEPGPQGPLIRLDGDDRSGTHSTGENLYIDLSRAAEINRILIFAFIYEGVPNWAGANAVVTLHQPGEAPLEISLDEHDPRSPMCAIALVQNNGGELVVSREVRYVRGGHSQLDDAYRWGMRWKAGRK